MTWHKYIFECILWNATYTVFWIKCHKISGCGGTYTASSGEIKSPNYPNNYPNDKNCEYRITLPAGKVRKSNSMSLLPDTQNCGLRMRRKCRERFPRHRLQREPPDSEPGIHRGTCVTHVLWCMSGSLIRGGRENVPSIPGACATHNFTYLVRGPLTSIHVRCLCGM